MKQNLLLRIGFMLALVGCRGDRLPMVVVTPTALDSANAVTPRAVTGTTEAATEQPHIALEATAAVVRDWFEAYFPGEYGVTVYDQVNLVSILADTKILDTMVDYDLGRGSPIPREYWPASLQRALADQDPTIAVDLTATIFLTEPVIMTDTLQITDTTGK